MTTKTRIKAGIFTANHNARQLRIKTGVKAGRLTENHNQRLLRA